MEPKGVELSRISGDLDFSDDEDFNTKLLEKDPEARRLAEQVKIDNVQAWLKDQSEVVNCRNFNENDIMGNFHRDWAGKIINQDQTLREMQFRDLDDHAVNKKGYLIDEETGDLRSKYTYEVVLKNDQLIGLDGGDKYELPLPFRMERHNFNPHQCYGNFDPMLAAVQKGIVTSGFPRQRLGSLGAGESLMPLELLYL